MQIGALGDIHGEFDTVDTIMGRHPEIAVWVCVGDVASNEGEYFEPPQPLYFIKGNNEDFDVLASAIDGKTPAPTLHYLRNGGPHLVGPWRSAVPSRRAGTTPPPRRCRRRRDARRRVRRSSWARHVTTSGGTSCAKRCSPARR
jgi:hypothetical protein